MTPQEGSSLLKSCARRSFFTRDDLEAFATIRIALATHGLRNTGLDNQTKNIIIAIYRFTVI